MTDTDHHLAKFRNKHGDQVEIEFKTGDSFTNIHAKLRAAKRGKV